MLFIRLGVVVW